MKSVGISKSWSFVLATVALVGCNADQEPASEATDGGARDASAEASQLPDGQVDGATPDVVNEDVDASSADVETDGAVNEGGLDAAADAHDSATPMPAVFAGANYVDGTVKLVAVDLAAPSIGGSQVFNAKYADVSPVASKGRGFVLSRSDDRLLVLDSENPSIIKNTIPLSEVDASGSANPHGLVLISGSKAYVPLFGKNQIAIVDVDAQDAGVPTTIIDLAQFVDASDPDGLVDVSDAVLDPDTHRAYFLLQRIPAKELGATPDYLNRCLGIAPLVVAVDTASDQFVDLNGDAGGLGASLLGVNPGSLVPDWARGRLLIADSGCYEVPEGGVTDADLGPTFVREGRGIEALDLATLTPTWLYHHSDPSRLSSVVIADATHAFVSWSDAAFKTHWFAWNPTQPTLGTEITGFPSSAKYVGGNQVIGVLSTSVDGGKVTSVVSYDVATGQTATVLPNLYGDFAASASPWALLR